MSNGKFSNPWILFGLLIALFSCNPNSRKENTITVFVPASLTDIITDVAESYELRSGTKVKLNFASSGILARQFEQGAEVDIYISANNEWMTYLQDLGKIESGQVANIARNELVFVTNVNSEFDSMATYSFNVVKMLLSSGRLAVGDPSYVPAGKYAQQGLIHMGWYEQIEKSILPTRDVRATLMLVELNEVPLGIVYRTDALKSEKVKIVGEFLPGSHDPILYSAGLCSDNQSAKDFFFYLNSDETDSIWSKYGFRK